MLEASLTADSLFKDGLENGASVQVAFTGGMIAPAGEPANLVVPRFLDGAAGASSRRKEGCRFFLEKAAQKLFLTLGLRR